MERFFAILLLIVCNILLLPARLLIGMGKLLMYIYHAIAEALGDAETFISNEYKRQKELLDKHFPKEE